MPTDMPFSFLRMPKKLSVEDQLAGKVVNDTQFGHTIKRPKMKLTYKASSLIRKSA